MEKNFTLNISYEAFQQILENARSSYKDTFIIDKSKFGEDAIVRMKVKDSNNFKVSFQNVISKPGGQRGYHGFELVCHLSGNEDGTSLINYKIRLKIIALASLALFSVVMVLMGILDLTIDKKLDSSYVLFIFFALIAIPYRLIKGKRGLVKRAKMFLGMFPGISDKAQLSEQFSW